MKLYELLKIIDDRDVLIAEWDSKEQREEYFAEVSKGNDTFHLIPQSYLYELNQIPQELQNKEVVNIGTAGPDDGELYIQVVKE